MNAPSDPYNPETQCGTHPMGGQLLVLPLKNGNWRLVRCTDDTDVIDGAVRLSPAMVYRWRMAWRMFWMTRGRRLAISPEMWLKA